MDGSLLSALTLKRSRACTGVERSGKGIALDSSIDAGPIDSSTKDQRLSRFGANHEVLLVDRAFHSSGLVRTLEVPFNGRAFLLEIEIFRRGSSVRIVAVQRPFTGNACGKLLRRRLLRPCGNLIEND